MRSSAERGSSLLDVLLASAIGAMIALISIGVLRLGLSLTVQTTTAAGNFTHMRTVTDRLHARSASAWSVFVPTIDIFHHFNGDGHEVDFFTETANHVPLFWAERYDASKGTLTGYSYATPGDPPTIHDDPLTDVRSFTAHYGHLEDLALESSPLYDPLFAHATLHNADLTFSSERGMHGGNAFVSLHMRIGKIAQDITLAAATTPTGFTVIVPY